MNINEEWEMWEHIQYQKVVLSTMSLSLTDGVECLDEEFVINNLNL